MGLLRDPPACTPSTQRKEGNGPRPHAPRTGSLGRGCPQPRTTLAKAGDAPRGRHLAAETAHNASSQFGPMSGW